MASVGRGEGRPVTAADLKALLARLGPDAERAALEYKRLHRTLMRFFDWRGAALPDACADETLDRLARKLADETAIGDVHQYAHGIARLVLLEQRRRPSVMSIDTDMRAGTSGREAPAVVGGQGQADERLHACLDRCLAALSDDNRQLIVEYYVGERITRIENRRRLAAGLALSDNALRSRVQRLRDRLEECLRACTDEDGS